MLVGTLQSVVLKSLEGAGLEETVVMQVTAPLRSSS